MKKIVMILAMTALMLTIAAGVTGCGCSSTASGTIEDGTASGGTPTTRPTTSAANGTLPEGNADDGTAGNAIDDAVDGIGNAVDDTINDIDNAVSGKSSANDGRVRD